jgi:hypothetical protein
MKFTEETLGEEIKKQWGEHGAHYEVYKMMLDQVKSNQKQSSITAVGNSFTWEEVEEFGRQAFYKGREVERYNENGIAIFKRPTYNGYLRELDSK